MDHCTVARDGARYGKRPVSRSRKGWWLSMPGILCLARPSLRFQQRAKNDESAARCHA